MPSRPVSPPLLYADTETSADALYFGRVSVPDAFIAFGINHRKYAVVSALEFGRVKRESDFDVVLALEDYLSEARTKWPRRAVGVAEVIYLLAREFKQKRFSVPGDFPARVYAGLTGLGLKLDVAAGTLFPQREIKTPAEAEAIRRGNFCSARGLAAAEAVLRQSRIRGRSLLYQGRPLTSERLKFAIEVACLEAGGISVNTIAAGGDQACDPHQRGSGPLRPHELIIVDIFPRLSASGYFGDMTRTFLRGRANDAQRRLVATVRAAQKLALGAIHAGVNGRSVHGQVNDLFTARGYETKSTPQGSIGYFHGTGHGVGLAVHEAPRMSRSIDYILKAGSVVTVEPGLYYPGLGACRIEDVVQVTPRGVTLLSRYPYQWEL